MTRRYPSLPKSADNRVGAFARIGILTPIVVRRRRDGLTLASSAQPQSLLRPRWEQIARLCAERTGSEYQSLRWLETPKMALDWRKPIDVLGTEEGCDRVTELLNEL